MMNAQASTGGRARFVALVALAVIVMSTLPAAARAPKSNRRAQRAYVPGQVLVRYRPGADAADRAAVRSAQRLRRARGGRLGSWELTQLPAGESAAEALEELQDDPRVAEVSLNYEYRTTGVADDTYYGSLWGFENRGQSGGTTDADVDAAAAWARTRGSKDVAVAVVDTGVALEHPDLASNLWKNPVESLSGNESNGFDDDGNGYVDDVHGYDWYDQDGDPDDEHGHGTHVAGVIAARGGDGYGVPGLSWNSRIMALRVLGPTGSGTTASIAGAFRYAAANGARVVNASLGGRGSDPVLSDAIRESSETLFVVAAGNDGTDNDSSAFYPCNDPAPNLVCVGASDQADALASFSNRGVRTVDLAAPGVSIVSTWLSSPAGNGRYGLVDSPVAYANSADTWIEKAAPVDLTGRTNCVVRYRVRASLQAGDIVQVERKIAEGAWLPLGTEGAGSTQRQFVTRSASLLADGQPGVSVRFRLVTDALGTDDGVAIDDVAIACSSGTVWSEGFESDIAGRWVTGGTADRWTRARAIGEWRSASGTSMATPHVSGAAALVLAVYPSSSVAHLRNVLLGSVDRRSSLRGKVATAGRLNAARAVAYAPDVTAPARHAVRVPFVQRRSSRFYPRWTASDDGSGVRLFYARERHVTLSGSSTRPRTWARTGRTSAPFRAGAGTYCFAVRARDNALNLSRWSSERCSVVPLDDRSIPTVRGTWSRRTDSRAYLGTVSIARARGSALRADRVAFKRLWLVATMCSSCGTVDVYRGSTRLARISLRSSVTRTRRLLPVKAYSRRAAAAPVTVRVVSSGRTVRIEGLAASAV